MNDHFRSAVNCLCLLGMAIPRSELYRPLLTQLQAQAPLVIRNGENSFDSELLDTKDNGEFKTFSSRGIFL